MSRTTRIAVTGGDGIMGTALRAYFPHADYLSRASCDVANAASVKAWFSQHTYDTIIHAGAATHHATDPAQLTQVNVVGTANVAHWARKQGARFVYLSSDYVVGDHGLAREDAPLNPVGHYAWSKLGGECVARSLPNHAVIRGSWYETLLLTRASTDGFTSKLPVAKAASMVATVSASTFTGTIHIGGMRRSLYEITSTEFNPKCAPILRKDVTGVSYPIPADTSLDTSLYRARFGR